MSSMRSLLELLQASLALPCLTTEVWLKYGVAQKEVAWLHTVIGLIPTYIFLFQHYTRQDLIDFTVVMNIVSLMGVGFIHRDIFAMGASVLIFLSYCIFFFRSELSYEPVSRQIYNYCMAAFTFCAYKAAEWFLQMYILLFRVLVNMYDCESLIKHYLRHFQGYFHGVGSWRSKRADIFVVAGQ